MAISNVLEYVTIASMANAADFGDLTVARSYLGAGIMSSTRGIWCSGLAPGASDVMDYITIASTGDASGTGVAMAIALGG